jgi:exosortase/archaeosortase family protein
MMKLKLFNKKLEIDRCILAWAAISLISISVWFVLEGPSLTSHLAVIIWIVTAGTVVYLYSRKDLGGKLKEREQYALYAAGAFFCVFSFLFVPSGLGNAPYSIDDFSILLSGATLIFFSYMGHRRPLLASSVPIVGVIGFQILDKLTPMLEEVSAPLRYPVIQLTTGVLKLLGVEATGEANRVLFTTSQGYPVGVPIVFECTGVESMSTFLLAAAIVFYMFRDMPVKKKLAFLAVGIAGTYAANILRVVAICMSGYYYGVGGVMNITHVNAGWIAFSTWMFIFWYAFFRSYMRGQKKSGDKDKSKKARNKKAYRMGKM